MPSSQAFVLARHFKLFYNKSLRPAVTSRTRLDLAGPTAMTATARRLPAISFTLKVGRPVSINALLSDCVHGASHQSFLDTAANVIRGEGEGGFDSCGHSWVVRPAAKVTAVR